MKKKLRPKGCAKTFTGRHIPTMRQLNIPSSINPIINMEFYCSACGKIDDTDELQKYLVNKSKKIDDRDLGL